MKFNFKALIENLKNDDNKRAFLNEYEKIVGKITTLQKELWYKKYVRKIRDYIIIPLLSADHTEEYEQKTDWFLLVQLIFSSFSSEAEYIIEETEHDIRIILKIHVKSNSESVTKTFHELWPFQIDRLFDIYINEQMNLQKLMYDHKREKKSIKNKRKECIKHIQLQWAKVHLALLKYPQYVYDYTKITELVTHLEYTKKVLFSKN